MEWFEGDIAVGIKEAKKRNTLFVVYIRDGSEDSKKMDQTWESGNVAEECKKFGFVVMRFLKDSAEFKMFLQFYPVLIVPSVSFISGESGILLEAAAGHVDASSFVERIRKAAKSLRTSQEPSKAASDQPVPSQLTQSSTGQQSTEPAVPSPQGGPTKEKESVQERAARLRKKMEEVHAKKEAQKKEAAKNKELERRKVGQAVQKAQEKRAEQEARQFADEIRKDRLEDKQAKQKIREQIARDRAEKDAKFAAMRREEEQRKLEKQEGALEQKRAEEAARAAASKETARIQFRLPDGSKLLHQFPSSATLGEAHQYVVEQVGETLKEFNMSIAFPRRQFGTSDMDTSLLDLQLAPSAAIIILPSSGAGRSSKAVSSGQGLIAMLFAPIIFLWNLLYTFIFGTQSSQPEERGAANRSDPPQQQSFDSMGARPKSSYARRRTPASSGEGRSIARQEGNIHRLNNDNDNDDENNTWNGNSTQQM